MTVPQPASSSPHRRHYQRIEAASWPSSLPHPKEEKVMSIICGNSRLHWALHEGVDKGYTPCLFWRTSILPEEEIEGFLSSRAPTDTPCAVLDRYLPDAAQRALFGSVAPKPGPAAGGPSQGRRGGDDGGGQQHNRTTAYAWRALQRVPVMSVFLISTNRMNEKGIEYLLTDIPCQIYRLTPYDFYTDKQGAYATIGVDRVCSLLGASYKYGNPVLVIDGGTAMTYTSTDVDGNIQGGGITNGVNSKLSSLNFDTGNSLPYIPHDELQGVVEALKHSKQPPLQLFTRQSTKHAILSGVLYEISSFLHTVVRNFVVMAKDQIEQYNKRPEEGEKQEEEKKRQEAAGVNDEPKKAGETATTTATATPSEKKGPEGTDKDGDAVMKDSSAAAAATPASTTPGGATPSAAKAAVEKESAVAKKTKGKGMINSTYTVCITGGDGYLYEKVLRPDHTNLLERGVVSASSEKNGEGGGSAGGNDASGMQQEFKTAFHKHLVHNGIVHMLNKHAIAAWGEVGGALASTAVSSPPATAKPPVEQKRDDIIGQRVAVDRIASNSTRSSNSDSDNVRRGTVARVVSSMKSTTTASDKDTSTLDQDIFHVLFDNGQREDLSVVQIYHGLVTYAKFGERKKETGKERKERAKKKSSEAGVVAKMLEGRCPAVKEHLKQRKEQEEEARRKKQQQAEAAAAAKAKAKAKAATPASGGKRSYEAVSASDSSKKAKAGAGSAQKKAREDPKRFMKRRVAKFFDTDLYFGVVDGFIPAAKSEDGVPLWHVTYDDGDEEDYEEEELLEGLELHKHNTSKDLKGKRK